MRKMNAVHAPPIGQFDNNGGAHALADGMSGMSLGPYDAHENSPELWGAEAVCSWLTRNGFGALVEGFMQNDIRGAQLFNLQPDDYYQLGVTQLGVRKRLENAIAQLGPVKSHPSAPEALATPCPCERALKSCGQTRLRKLLRPRAPVSPFATYFALSPSVCVLASQTPRCKRRCRCNILP